MGMLVQYTSEIAGRVIFGLCIILHTFHRLIIACTVSHEWLSLGHAGKSQTGEIQF